MATRKSLVIVSGLFQELNSSADKLDLAGNSSSDIPECEANKIIRKTFKYITATVERQPQ